MKRRITPKKASRKSLNSSKFLYVLIGLILISETVAIGFLKEYSVSGSVVWLLVGLALYACVAAFLVQSFKYEGMGIVNILWSACSVIAVVLTGVLLFGETVTTNDVIGMAMVIAGVTILRIGESKRKARGGTCMHMASSPIPHIS